MDKKAYEETQRRLPIRDELKKFIESCNDVIFTSITKNQLMYFVEKHAKELEPILKKFAEKDYPQ